MGRYFKRYRGKLVLWMLENWSSSNVYVKALFVNGKKRTEPFLKYEELKDGVKLHFVMSDKPNKTFGIQ